MSNVCGVAGSRRAQAGISLIEVMVTLTILAVVALALADGLVTSMRVTSSNEERAAAMREARNQLETIAGHKQWLVNSDPRPSRGTSYYPRYVIDSAVGSKDHGVITALETKPVPGGAVVSTPVCFDVFYGLKGSVANNTAGSANQERLQPLFSPTASAVNGTQDGDKTGEIVVMFDEDVQTIRADNTYAYGRDLTGGLPATGAPFGTPDGKPDGTTFPPIGDMDMNKVIGGDMRVLGLNPASGVGTTGRLPVGVIIRWVGAEGREERYELWTVMTFFQENFGSEQTPIVRYD